MSNINQKIIIGSSRMRNELYRELERVFLQFDLTTSQFAILEVLYSQGELLVGEIQVKILSTPGNVPVVIENLKKKGLITKRQDLKDRRCSVIALTDSGKELVKKILPIHDTRLDELLRGYTEEEKAMLVKLFLKFKEFSNNNKANLSINN